jgi:hypothetical protein
MPAEVEFTEATAQPRVESVSYSHLSIEVGHLYMEDFQRGIEYLRSHFRQIAPWVEAARQSCVEGLGKRTARISTCLLVDDYFTMLSPPSVVIRQLVDAAAEAGLRVDYLARESGCARAGNVPLAELVVERLVAEPPPNTNGSRPTPAECGWISNGERSTSNGAIEAMSLARSWTPPRETAAIRHSTYVDVELWNDDGGGHRTWSCTFLAAVWQLLRLGLVRYDGKPVGSPRSWDGDWPASWNELPAVVRLEPTADSFYAYRTLSILAGRFLPVEHAVRVILSQVAVDLAVNQQALDRSRLEGLELPTELVDRIEYVLTGNSGAWR